ncbi:MAG: hypothetical protein ACI4SF_05970, partial [Oscillospiraceae bacterium]
DRNSVYLYYSAEIINHVTIVHMSKPLTFSDAKMLASTCKIKLSGLWAVTQEAALFLLSSIGGADPRKGQPSCNQYGANAEKGGRLCSQHDPVHYHPIVNKKFHIWFGFDLDAVSNGKIIFTF